MGIFGDAWDWTKGAVSDAYDWAGGALDTVSGQAQFKATPYGFDPNTYGSMLQQAAGGQMAAGLASGQAMAGVGGDLASAGNVYGGRIQQAANNVAAAGRDAAGGLVGRGDAALASANQYAGGLTGIGQAAGQEGFRTGRELDALNTQLTNAPSYADEAARAAIQTQNAQAMSRAGSARGANSALMLRDAAAGADANSRAVASEAGAMKAREMSDRFGMRAGLTNQAGAARQAGLGAQGGLYGNAAAVAAGGQNAATGAYQAAGDFRLRGEEGQGELTTAAGDMGMRGQEGRANAYGKAGEFYTGGANSSADTLSTAAGIGMQGHGINAGSVDAANAANANVASGNAQRGQDFWGGVVKAGAGALMTSDVRAKEDIAPLGTSRLTLGSNGVSVSGTSPGALGPGPGYDVAMKSAADAQKRESERQARIKGLLESDASDGGGGILGELIGGAVSSYLSDRRAKTAARPVYSDERGKGSIRELLEMAVDPEDNRENLGEVQGYTYRYKPEVAARIGEDTGRRPGIMAQDLEDAAAGEAAVMETENGKALDVNRSLGFALAGVAGLDKRLKLLEQAAGGRGKAA